MITQIKSILHATTLSLGVDFPESSLVIETPNNPSFGDLSTNIAMLLAKSVGKSPREIATYFIKPLKTISSIHEVSIAGAGFINITFSHSFWQNQLLAVQQNTLGGIRQCSSLSKDIKSQKILIEYVSANPTGPLHVGHARGAAFGDSLRRIYEYAGYTVDTEYYINDAGNQMNILGNSVFLRLKELLGDSIIFPEDHYQGDYITSIAKEILLSHDVTALSDSELLSISQKTAIVSILDTIQSDLELFHVKHTHWFSEQSLIDSGERDIVLTSLMKKKYIYEKDGALWFASSQFADEKDRVIRKQDTSYTYFASDIAYLANKQKRGYTSCITILGADHHGYIERMYAAVQALGEEKDSLLIILIQLVSLLREGKPLSMSTRSGTFDTLRELITEVGSDAARFIFLSRKHDTPLDFDLDLVTKKTMDNPVFYVQYAHARIAAILRKVDFELPHVLSQELLSILIEKDEIALIKIIVDFPNRVHSSIAYHAPHFITIYLMELSALFHKYYSRFPIYTVNHKERSLARISLCIAVKNTISTGLLLLGVSAPEEM
ncbi:MAG: arginine--tRNA ligase [Desulfovibrionaceae bacterium]